MAADAARGVAGPSLVPNLGIWSARGRIKSSKIMPSGGLRPAIVLAVIALVGLAVC